ncbi:IclR family transcriptional regulator [Frankia sp. Hr75.2]|nr:IclR family transcriptional regulator [Frankia sp. Hr75.2]
MTAVLEPRANTRASATNRADPGGSLTSVGKALALLDAFRSSAKVLGVTELANRAGISKSTAHRLLGSMVEYGYLQRVENRYCLSPQIFELGNQVPMCSPSGLRERAAPVMTELFAATEGTIHLGMPVDNEVLYIAKIAGRHAIPWSTRVGARSPAHCTALGKALLAFGGPQAQATATQFNLHRFTAYTLYQPGRLLQSLEQARSDGIAVDHEEFRLGLTCIAAPIIDHHTGRAIAAISISSVTTAPDAHRFARPLQRAAEKISDLVRTVPASDGGSHAAA